SDMRESPAIPIIASLLEQGAVVSAFDPWARSEAEKMFEGKEIQFAASLEEAIAGCEAILVLTRWPEFKRLENLVPELPNAPLVIDGRRMLDSRCFGNYAGIGFRRRLNRGRKRSRQSARRAAVTRC